MVVNCEATKVGFGGQICGAKQYVAHFDTRLFSVSEMNLRID
jgi:hypothetical protein